ncbi:Sugar phosphate permease precursor [Sphingobium yanoikuyae]|uniref:Sugar phosphate permease n=1 Tax=Sphingobium yanoikuyae TaxID=13690 RepID=A0A084ESF7_SPHYA|nr:MFS transporter [Sphingobium yanoikuyae]KEZ20899.1 Sugar phosphate permease precursor [Sphingobium yanoikuyae]
MAMSNIVEGQTSIETPARPVRASASNWAILALLAIGALIAFVDRTSISSALAVPSFKAHFQLTDVDRGWVNSAFFWSYALLQIPMGWIVDRYGVKTPYTICFVLWCAASAATGLVTTLAGLILMRLIVGAAEAVVVPASYRWIRNNFKEGQSGTAVGLYMLGNKFGPAIGAPVAAWLILAFDWRAMFVITGLVGAIWLLPWMLMVRNDLPKAGEMVEVKRKASAVSFGTIMASPLVWGTLVVNFCYNYFTFYCMTWMPAYLVEQRGLSLEKMGLYSFFSFAGIAIVALVAGWSADRLIARGGDPVFVRKAFVISGFVLACTVLLGAQTQSLQWALFWNVASLSGLGLATANNLALCRLTLIPAPAVGLVTGVQQVATSLAGIVAPILSGWLLHVSGDYALPMQVIFVFLVIGALTTWLLLRPQWAPKIPEAAPAA